MRIQKSQRLLPDVKIFLMFSLPGLKKANFRDDTAEIGPHLVIFYHKVGMGAKHIILHNCYGEYMIKVNKMTLL